MTNQYKKFKNLYRILSYTTIVISSIIKKKLRKGDDSVMKKNMLMFVFAAALCCAVTGCRSKDKIDLTSSHTTAAEETMSPSTEALETETAAETAEESASSSSDGKAPSDALSIRSQIATEKEGKVSIEYPILSNLHDSGTEDTVNALLKENATRILSDYEVSPETDTVEIKCSIISLDRSKAVIAYEGSLMKQGAAHPTGIFYTTTVDLGDGTLSGLSDYADAYTMAGYIISDDCVVYRPSESAEIREYLKGLSLEECWDILKQCDFTAQNLSGFPQAFSYENEGSIYISMPVPHALGDYAIIRYTPDTK